MQATELLSRQTEITPREKELMKAVPDMDMINTFVGTVKISMPGLVKIKQDVRKNKKKKWVACGAWQLRPWVGHHTGHARKYSIFDIG